RFGLLFSRPVDGHVYAQPLYVSGLRIGGAVHNVLFVATEHNSVYAFDADNASVTAPLWTTNFGTPMTLNPGIENQPVMPPYTVSCRDMYPEGGITSTPVIDRTTGRIYIVAKTQEGGKFYQRLHALDILPGAETAGSPVAIEGSVTGKGEGG